MEAITPPVSLLACAACHTSTVILHVSIVIAAVANTLGDSLLFYMSRYNKAQMMPYIEKHKRKLALSNVLMKRYGDKIIFFQKYLYGIKTLIPLAIGLTRYSFAKFNFVNAVSSVIWAVSLGYASYYAGESIISFMDYTSENSWIMPLIVFGLLGGLWYYFQQMTKKR